MKLITESVENVSSYITETTNGIKNYYIEGEFIMTESPNRNNRKYSRAMMEAEVERYTNELIKPGQSWGELNHPNSPAVDPKNVSHIVESLTQQGNIWIGKARVLGDKFSCATTLKGMIEEGFKFGVSTRGVGSLSCPINKIVNVESYKMSAIDTVMDPSIGKFVNAIMENVEWIIDPITGNYEAQKLVEEIQVERHDHKINEERELFLFTKFMKLLSK